MVKNIVKGAVKLIALSSIFSSSIALAGGGGGGGGAPELSLLQEFTK